MTTTELTGAEDVAWDLSDLYDSSDDPRLEDHIHEAEQAAAAFRDRYHGKVAELDAAALAEAGIPEGLIRVSVGIEDLDDIVRAFDLALDAAASTEVAVGAAPGSSSAAGMPS